MIAPETESPRLSDPAAYPGACEPLEEVAAAEPGDAATALAFALDRLTVAGGDQADARPWVLATTPSWLRERGRLFVQGLARAGPVKAGLAPDRLIWVPAERETDALWALEEALKSGAVAAGLATVERPTFVVTRRLDFAARAGGAKGVILRAGPALDLSAARRRWRIGRRPSGQALFDSAAPGPARLKAELVRRRDGPSGVWELEQNDETGRFGMVAGLAGHRLDAVAPARTGRRATAA